MVDFEDVKKHWNAQRSFEWFASNVLGHVEDKELKYYPLNAVQKEVCRVLQSKRSSKMFLMPRHSIKSQLITVGYVLWRLVRNPNLRVLIYSDSAGKASGFLSAIKNHIEGRAAHSKFREMYPNWETDPHTGGGMYNESRIIVSARKLYQKEPTIDTGGIDSTKTGNHYDLIVFDDIVSDVNTTTKAQMDKVHDLYKKSLSLLIPGGDIVIVGTRWHYGDTYGRIIDENRDKENFELFIRDAEEEVNGRLIFEDIGLNRAFLDYQRGEQGSYLYSCLYRNSPVDEETAVFKAGDFRFYEPHPDLHTNLFVTCACDPAGEGEDFTAITVVGTDLNKNLFVLEAVNRHLRPNQILDEVIRLNYKWKFDRFAIEKNFFKGMLEKELREEILNQQKNNSGFKAFSVEEITTSAKQRNFPRILALQPFHERGAILFPNTSKTKALNTLEKVYSELAFQMLQFTIDGSKSPHDDLLISLALHTEILVRGGEAPQKEAPKDSAAWLEKQWFEKYEQVQRRLPRHARRYFDPSFN